MVVLPGLEEHERAINAAYRAWSSHGITARQAVASMIAAGVPEEDAETMVDLWADQYDE